MSYLCIKLNLSGIDMILQLKISHGLVDISPNHPKGHPPKAMRMVKSPPNQP